MTNTISAAQFKICEILSVYTGIHPSEIKLDSTLESLAADSIDEIKIIIDIEDEFNVEIPAQVLEEIETVQQLINLVERLWA